MKKGTKVLHICLSCLLIYVSTIYDLAEAKGRLSELAAQTRALIKDWIYKGWVQNDYFFEVVPGELYRSSQLPPSRLEQYIKRYGIKTIINLSGDEPYYWISTQEKQIAEKCNIVLFSMKTHALTITPLDQVRSLLAILLSSPLPILIHCFAGSDRTGEACAFYLLATDKGISAAISQLSPRFKHKKWLFPYKYYLVTNLDKIYPNLLDTIKQASKCRLSYEELKNIKPEELYTKTLEKNNEISLLPR